MINKRTNAGYKKDNMTFIDLKLLMKTTFVLPVCMDWIKELFNGNSQRLRKTKQ